MEIIKKVQSDEASTENGDINASKSGIMLRSEEGTGRTAELVDISERSWIFKHLTQHDPLRICRIYVTPDKGQAYPALLPGGKHLTPETLAPGWEDRTYGRDLLALPVVQPIEKFGFVCPECGEIS